MKINDFGQLRLFFGMTHFTNVCTLFWIRWHAPCAPCSWHVSCFLSLSLSSRGLCWTKVCMPLIHAAKCDHCRTIIRIMIQVFHPSVISTRVGIDFYFFFFLKCIVLLLLIIIITILVIVIRFHLGPR